MANKIAIQTPEQLKTLFEAMNIAPSWLSKRFIMTEMIGWSDEDIIKNAELKNQEDQNAKIGNKVGSFR